MNTFHKKLYIGGDQYIKNVYIQHQKHSYVIIYLFANYFFPLLSNNHIWRKRKRTL